jgi:phosphatidylinositol glycan class K
MFVVDTCQATTLYKHFRSPNVLAAGSSSRGQNSYSVR